MSFILQPWPILLAALCRLLSHPQQQIIAFQTAQIEALPEKVDGKRVLLDHVQRCQLVMNGHAIGRKALRALNTIATPDTILHRHRELVAKKWEHSDR